jgi:preprotein translocase subunit SecE
MSAQRRSSAANRRARGAATRRGGGGTATVPPVDEGSDGAVAVASQAVPAPASAPAGGKGPQPRMAARPEATGRRARIDGVRRYINDTRAELRRVTWPDQLTVRNLTIVVIAVSAVMGLLLGGIDFVLFRLFEAL